jgi:hypothetical protein
MFRQWELCHLCKEQWVHPAFHPCCFGDIRRRVHNTNGLSEQAKKISEKGSKGRVTGLQSLGMDP